MNVSKYLASLRKLALERFPRLIMIYRLLSDSLHTLKEPQKTPMGFKLIGNSNMEDGTFECEEVEIVKRCLGKTDIFINIGANVGYYCCIALSYGKPTVAFEPIESNLKYLYKNIKANNWENDIEIFPLALSDKTGLLDIFGDGTGASLIKGWADTPEQYVRAVPSTTLSNVLGTRFKGKKCFILVDIEGSEKSMLDGAVNLLETDPKPIWMVEISIKEHQPKGKKINPNLINTFQTFWECGYEAWTAKSIPRPIDLDELTLICKSGEDTIGTHNFLFMEKGMKANLLDA